MTYETLRYEEAEGVGTVTLSREKVLNAMNEPMRRELTDCFTRLATDDGVRAIVVTGAGDRAFSAGADVREFVEPASPVRMREQRQRVDFRQAMDRCPQPILAAIRGFALGGGLELALACDLRVAAEDAQLGLTEINLGIIPGGGGTQRLPRLVGRGKALEMILTGVRLTGAEALRIGLVERVVPAANVLAETQALAKTMASKAPVALRYAKEAVVKGLAMSLADGLRLENDLSTLLRTTEDRIEGARAFLERRPPALEGSVTFAYYARLSRAQQAIYRKSDAITAIELPRPDELFPLVSDLERALAAENHAATQLVTERLVRGLTDAMGIPSVRVDVLAARPHAQWGELHGLYTVRPGERGKIQLWMRTAKQKRVVAFRTYLRTVLHEVGHHVDYELLGLKDSFHTEGFYKRESSLFYQLVPRQQPVSEEPPAQKAPSRAAGSPLPYSFRRA